MPDCTRASSAIGCARESTGLDMPQSLTVPCRERLPHERTCMQDTSLPGPGEYSLEYDTIKQRSDEAAVLIQSSFRAHANRRKSRGLFGEERKRAEEINTNELSSAAQLQPLSDFGKRSDEIRGHFSLGASGKRFDAPGSIYFECARRDRSALADLATCAFNGPIARIIMPSIQWGRSSSHPLALARWISLGA
jgi:hypothetical protein